MKKRVAKKILGNVTTGAKRLHHPVGMIRRALIRSKKVRSGVVAAPVSAAGAPAPAPGIEEI